MAEEMGRLVKRLLCKHDDVSSNLQHPHKNWGWKNNLEVQHCVCHGGRYKKISRDGWQTSKSPLQAETLSQKIIQRAIESVS